MKNCRPISVLSCLSKLLERIMFNQLFKYLLENSIFYEKKFGFQASHTTEHAVILLVNQLYQSLDESKFTLEIFIDLKKAFDTVDHKILTKTLSYMGLKVASLNKYRNNYMRSSSGVNFRAFVIPNFC